MTESEALATILKRIDIYKQCITEMQQLRDSFESLLKQKGAMVEGYNDTIKRLKALESHKLPTRAHISDMVQETLSAFDKRIKDMEFIVKILKDKDY